MLYLLVLSLLMIPSIFTLIPSFMIIVNLGLIDSRLALILPWMAGGQVFGILVCRGYLESLPGAVRGGAHRRRGRVYALYAHRRADLLAGAGNGGHHEYHYHL